MVNTECLHCAPQLLTFSIPLTLYVGRCLDLVISDKYKPRPSPFGVPALRWLVDHCMLLLLLAWMIYLSLAGFAIAYSGSGYMALLFCPMRTWSVGLAIYLYWVANTQTERTQLTFDLKKSVNEKRVICESL